jgi:hypothetical protein
MEHRRWIVVGTDFSSIAERAAAPAAALGAGIACVLPHSDRDEDRVDLESGGAHRPPEDAGASFAA